jgi:hypothetical protein
MEKQEIIVAWAISIIMSAIFLLALIPIPKQTISGYVMGFSSKRNMPLVMLGEWLKQ